MVWGLGAHKRCLHDSCGFAIFQGNFPLWFRLQSEEQFSGVDS